MRETTGRAAAPKDRRRNWRRGSLMAFPPDLAVIARAHGFVSSIDTPRRFDQHAPLLVGHLAHSLIRIKHGQLLFQKILFPYMDTRFLDSFVTVVDNGSIAEAARRLNLTPATIAQRIRTLEAEVGSRLIIRSGRTVRSTEAGAAILGRARNVLEEVRDLKSAAASDTASGQLRLGALPSVLAGLVPDILSLMTEKYPRIEIYLV